jgi:antitoxin component YwqK of YwqJK toxin-antitoxin module
MNRFFTAVLFLLTGATLAQPQQPFGKEGAFTFETDKPFKLLELTQEEIAPIATKKKKPRKKTFYGIKTKKGFTRRGVGERMVIELFYFLKRPQAPTPFVRDIYWYDFKRAEVRKTGYDPKKGVLLHGPYKRMQNNVVLEEGIFYVGAKHGRWMKFDRNDLVEDKEKYYKGWPKESIVTYYDPVERKKVKEMIPVEYNEREGYYVMYHENGTVAVTGEYRFNERIGDWTEFYPNGKRKKVVAYTKEAFEEARPFVRREWDLQGREIYTNNKGQ